MLVLFDHGTPAPLEAFLHGHSVKRAKDMGWDTLGNGDLLKAAEDAGFELLLTTDKSIRFQQNLSNRKLAIIVLGNSRWRLEQRCVERVVHPVTAAKPGEYVDVEIPNP
jgi:hypothetical protein